MCVRERERGREEQDWEEDILNKLYDNDDDDVRELQRCKNKTVINMVDDDKTNNDDGDDDDDDDDDDGVRQKTEVGGEYDRQG